jgi:uncharacterized protein
VKELLDYRYASELLNKTGFESSVADLYGVILGLIAGGIKRTDKEFKELLVNLLNDGDEFAPEVTNWINEQSLFITGQLIQGEGLKLLMPRDEATASIRIQALTELAHSMVTGFSCKQKMHSKLSHDVQEILRDIMDIAHTDTNVPDGDEIDRDLMILEEHVSLGAQLCFEECAASLYPNDNKDVFVLEDEDESGKPVELSAERMAIHEQESQFWEKIAKQSGSERMYKKKQ